jgi:hypothetical protein
MRMDAFYCTAGGWPMYRGSPPRLSPKKLAQGQWAWPERNQGKQAGEIQQVRLIARLAEMRACRGDGLELDRAESVRQMHREYGDQEHDRHRQARQRQPQPYQHHNTPHQLNQDGRPRQQLRERHSECLEDVREGIGPARQLREPVLHEPEAYDQPQG